MNRLPRRTRVFAALQRRTAREIETVTDYAAHREQRVRLQASAIGGFLFGREDRDAEVDRLEISLPGRELRARVHRPGDRTGARPCVLNFHGGGWVQGNPEQSAWLASRVAARTGAVVVSPTYRLAPEHPFPAAVDDAVDTWSWLVDNADRVGIDPERILVMGDSAGGNLAAVVALLARERPGPALRGQVLVYPGVDMYEVWPSEIENADAPVLTSRNMKAFARLYLGDAYGTEDPRASPIRAESHAGLPPALIVTADHDPLRDNGTHYRDVLAAAGVPVRYSEHAGAIHGFLSLPGVVPAARAAADDIVEFVRDVI